MVSLSVLYTTFRCEKQHQGDCIWLGYDGSVQDR